MFLYDDEFSRMHNINIFNIFNFLLIFFLLLQKTLKLKSSSNHGFVYIYHKYFVVTLKLTNYAEDTSLISLSAYLFMIFRGNSCIEAKYRQ